MSKGCTSIAAGGPVGSSQSPVLVSSLLFTSKSIQFESVSYSLPDKRKLLDGIDLKLPAGEVTAVVSLDPLEAV